MLLVSGYSILIGSVTERMVVYQGDMVVASSPTQSGREYSQPFNSTGCRYWTGIRISLDFLPKNVSRCEKIVG